MFKLSYKGPRTARGIILSTIKRRPKTGFTRKEISKVTGIPIQTVCPRVFELVEDRKVRVSKKNRRDASTVLYAR